MKNLSFVIGIFIWGFMIPNEMHGQELKNINLDESYLKRIDKNVIDIIDSNHIYIGDEESTSLFYCSLVPEQKINGALVLFPATGELVEDVFSNNIDLIKILADSNMLTIVLSVNYNLCVDKTTLHFINTALDHVLRKYKVSKDKFVLGGFSLGGMNAIRYTEISYENTLRTIIKPKAVYGVDPPLDLVGLYYKFTRIEERNFFEPAVYEAKDYLGKMNLQFGGSPDKKEDRYIFYSMYSRNQKDGGNAKYLKTIPVRIYSDPDIDWYLEKRQADYYDMNALDQTAMINQLQLMGNEQAEYINALGKGYRLNGQRHPHSWSIVEPVNCANWILKYAE